MTTEELNAIRYLTIDLAKEAFKQDYGSYGEEDDDYIREKLILDNYCEGVEDVLKILGDMKQEKTSKNDLGVLDRIRFDIEALEEGISSYHNDRPWVFKDEVLKIIDKRKELEQEPRWIPVAEKLPKYSEEVLTCSRYGGFIEIQSLEKLCNDYWEDQRGDRTDFDVVMAWMPLPTPYKKEDKDGNVD